MSNHAAEQAAVLALTKASSREWYRTAAAISAVKFLAGDLPALLSTANHEYSDELRKRVDVEQDLAAAHELIAHAGKRGLKLYTILDDDYPANLHMVFNRPPFIWVKGELRPADFRAIAVVGTRAASPDGVGRATRLARELAQAGVTVLSGLARGIDTAAHSAALGVPAGRTVAVVGQGLLTPA